MIKIRTSYELLSYTVEEIEQRLARDLKTYNRVLTQKRTPAGYRSALTPVLISRYLLEDPSSTHLEDSLNLRAANEARRTHPD